MVRMLEGSGEVMKEGVLEKRSEGLLQLWKKKHCLLTGEGLILLRPKQYLEQQHLDPHLDPQQVQEQQLDPQHRVNSSCSGGKELRFGDMKTVDSVERKGKHMYFTVVMADKRELDFRCPQDSGWNALITLAMVHYKNRRAMEAVQSSRQKLAQRGIGTGIGTGITGTGIGNTGITGTGIGNTGIGNTGIQSSGITNTGIGNTGIGTGIGNTGIGNTGNHCTGIGNTGIHNTGIQSTGIHNTGITNTGIHCTGIHNIGMQSTGIHNTGIHCTGVHCTGIPNTA